MTYERTIIINANVTRKNSIVCKKYPEGVGILLFKTEILPLNILSVN
jgi:hypothetical protein